jgi:hypothetical protein
MTYYFEIPEFYDERYNIDPMYSRLRISAITDNLATLSLNSSNQPWEDDGMQYPFFGSFDPSLPLIYNLN